MLIVFIGDAFTGTIVVPDHPIIHARKIIIRGTMGPSELMDIQIP